jgi:hypothetical protein
MEELQNGMAEEKDGVATSFLGCARSYSWLFFSFFVG